MAIQKIFDFPDKDKKIYSLNEYLTYIINEGYKITNITPNKYLTVSGQMTIATALIIAEKN